MSRKIWVQNKKMGCPKLFLACCQRTGPVLWTGKPTTRWQVWWGQAKGNQGILLSPVSNCRQP